MATKRQRFAERRKACSFSQEAFAEALGVDRTTVQRWEKGENDPQPWHRPKIIKLLDTTSAELDSLLSTEVRTPRTVSDWNSWLPPASDDELNSLELARRVQASDVGRETLDRLQRAFDELAILYPVASPQELLGRVRQHLVYAAHLMDSRKTLEEHRRLLVISGWFSLLGATLHIDLNQAHAATARLQTAATLAQHSDHPEIQAWCYETEAWRVLTDGDYEKALELSQTAQHFAPRGSSVAIQATAQEGRSRARLGQSKETYAAINHVQKMSASLETRQRPEHHYQYDPAKSLAYTATTLAWVGDPSAETFAREIISRLGPAEDVSKWPRRLASANIDLALALLARNRIDEACDAALKAIMSGRVVPSNHWRALEIVNAVEARKLIGAPDLREAYQGMKAIGGSNPGDMT
jgi:DNA-binding XRE family transcriptional regulator